MSKRYTAQQISKALDFESQVAKLRMQVAIAEDEKEKLRLEIDKFERLMLECDEEVARVNKELEDLADYQRANAELFGLFGRLDMKPEEPAEVERSEGGRMKKVSTTEKIVLIEEAMKAWRSHMRTKQGMERPDWVKPDVMPLNFLRDFIQRVKKTKIGNITIYLREAILKGGFELSGKTRSRGIKLK
ncbi:hypothetical protein OAI33_13935 [Pirellulaceae bacterium]|nr:hypothetical protein [Pirellulaceae bacterium]